MFCTAFLGILDLRTGQLQYCNAGHNAPYTIDAQGHVALVDVVPNLPLGLFGGFPYEGQQTMLDKDTLLYMFTDGVSEAESPDKELFGDDRLTQLLQECATLEPHALVEETFAQVKRHANGAEQSDDITVMCLKHC